jgi:multiple sugar transport system permease protein
MQSKRFAYAITLPITIALFFLLIFPTIYSIYMSFMSSAGGIKELVFVGFKNYKEVFTNPVIIIALRNTMLFMVGTVSLTVILGFGLALLLNEIKRGVGIFRTLFILPLAIAPVVTGFTFQMMFNPELGVVNYVLHFLRIPPIAWHTSMETALLTIILIDAWQWTPFILIVVYAGLQGIPHENLEAARIDGSNRLQEIWYIIIPSLKTILTIVIIFRFMDAFRSFDLVYIVTRMGGPANATLTMVMEAYLQSLIYFRIEMGTAIGVILLIITIIITQVTLKRVLPK